MTKQKYHTYLTGCAIFIITLIFPITAIARQLPDLGNENNTILSKQEAKLIGEVWLQQLRAANFICDDPIINSYLQNLGQKIIIPAKIKQTNFKFFAINDSSINAFAFFAWNIGIHNGLILATQNEQELAGAIAHEIAHITQEHLLRSIIKQQQTLPITLIGTITSILLKVPDLAIPILASQKQQMINNTREYEQEADNIGMQLLATAGFDPQGIISLFNHMAKQERYEPQISEYLRTHPISDTRIAEAKQRAKNFPYRQYQSSFNYLLIKARIENNASINRQEIIANFANQLEQEYYENKDATLYGYALALIANYQYPKAYSILKPLTKRHPNNLIIQLGIIELYLAQQQINLALQQLQTLWTQFPNNIALAIKYTETLLKANKITTAKTILLAITKNPVFEPILYKLLAQAEEQTNNKIGMYQATAEWNFCYGNITTALIQLELALKLANNNPQLKQLLIKRKTELEKFKQQIS